VLPLFPAVVVRCVCFTFALTRLLRCWFALHVPRFVGVTLPCVTVLLITLLRVFVTLLRSLPTFAVAGYVDYVVHVRSVTLHYSLPLHFVLRCSTLLVTLFLLVVVVVLVGVLRYVVVVLRYVVVHVAYPFTYVTFVGGYVLPR